MWINNIKQSAIIGIKNDVVFYSKYCIDNFSCTPELEVVLKNFEFLN